MADTIQCPHCGETTDGNRYCTACGKPLREDTPLVIRDPNSIVLFYEDGACVRAIPTERHPQDAADRLAAYLARGTDESVRVVPDTPGLCVEMGDPPHEEGTVYRVLPYGPEGIAEALSELGDRDDMSGFVAETGI